MKLDRRQKKKIELELIRREIELKFGVCKDDLRKLYYKDNDKFKEIVNWLYWSKSMSISNFFRILGLSQNLQYRKIIYSVLERRRKLHDSRRERLDYLTKCYLLGMRIADVYCELLRKSLYFLTNTSNYYGCEYFFNVFNTIKHVIVHPHITNRKIPAKESVCLDICFGTYLPSKNFEIDPRSKFDILMWITNQCNECIIEFLTAYVDCDGSFHECYVILWSKDLEILNIIQEILKRKFRVYTEISSQRRWYRKIFYLYIGSGEIVNEIGKRLRHPCKKEKCRKLMNEKKVGANLAWLWLLQNLSETPRAGFQHDST